MDVLRQRQGAGRFNHHTPMGKGQSLAPLVLPIENSIRMCHFRGLHRLLVAFCPSGFRVNYTTNMSEFEFRPGQL
jgi:hypothetical protein